MIARCLAGGLTAMAALIALPSMAQVPPDPSPTNELPYDRGYDKPTARGDAINADEAPVTRSLNTDAAIDSATRVEGDAAIRAQYDADMAKYRAQVEAGHRDAMRDQRRYDRQQRAYADAMAAWRDQVSACKHGHNRACEMPTPDPADFY